MTLTGKQARYLRGLGHHLKPVVSMKRLLQQLMKH